MPTLNVDNIERFLLTIGEFIGGKNVISSGLEFNNLLNNTYALLLLLGEERSTNFYKIAIKTAPQFIDLEIDTIIEHRRGDQKIYSAIGGIYGMAIKYVKDKLIKPSVSTKKVHEKLDELQLVNQRFLQTIKKPGMETFYMESMNL